MTDQSTSTAGLVKIPGIYSLQRKGRRVYLARDPEPEFAHPDRLRRLYIEPTNSCNLACRTCMRQDWEAGYGFMNEGIFGRILDGVRKFSHPPEIFFGGYGETLHHPEIIAMIERGGRVSPRLELISNGTLLSAERIERLAAAGLGCLIRGHETEHRRSDRPDRLVRSHGRRKAVDQPRRAVHFRDGRRGVVSRRHPRVIQFFSRGHGCFRWGTAAGRSHLAERTLAEIWDDPRYSELRQRLHDFAFAPCLTCNSCELVDLIGEDCFGNSHPACGACLWAHGYIHCP